MIIGQKIGNFRVCSVEACRSPTSRIFRIPNMMKPFFKPTQLSRRRMHASSVPVP